MKILEMNIGKFLVSAEEAFVFHSWIMTEVREQAQFAAGCAEIIQELRTVFICQGGDGFDLEDDLVIANEVRGERLNKSTSAILQSPRCL